MGKSYYLTFYINDTKFFITLDNKGNKNFLLAKGINSKDIQQNILLENNIFPVELSDGIFLPNRKDNYVRNNDNMNLSLICNDGKKITSKENYNNKDDIIIHAQEQVSDNNKLILKLFSYNSLFSESYINIEADSRKIGAILGSKGNNICEGLLKLNEQNNQSLLMDKSYVQENISIELKSDFVPISEKLRHQVENGSINIDIFKRISFYLVPEEFIIQLTNSYQNITK